MKCKLCKKEFKEGEMICDLCCRIQTMNHDSKLDIHRFFLEVMEELSILHNRTNKIIEILTKIKLKNKDKDGYRDYFIQ